MKVTTERSSEDITLLLAQLAKGDHSVKDKLIPLVYGELHRLAASYMRRERPDHTLQATALVHEAYLRLVQQHQPKWQSRADFFGLASQIMRRILVDHARGHLRSKRGGGRKEALNEDVMEALHFSPEKSGQILALDEALNRLAKLDSRQGQIVELRFFGGLTVEEIAEVLKSSPRTIRREWNVARAWLHMQLKQTHGSNSGEMGKGQSAV